MRENYSFIVSKPIMHVSKKFVKTYSLCSQLEIAMTSAMLDTSVSVSSEFTKPVTAI